MYYRIKPSIYEEYGIERDPRLPPRVSFKTGSAIPVPLETPVVFPTDNTADHPPCHFAGISIPVMSKLLVSALEIAGVDNMTLYEAILKNEDSGETWDDYYAVNILGRLACADLAASDYVELGRRPGEGPPLLRFKKLVIDPKKTRGMPLFRLAESPSQILIQDRILETINEQEPPGGWGISAFPVEESAG